MGHEWLGSGWLQLSARVSLGALLLAAAVSKWRAGDEVARSLERLGLNEPRVARTAGWALPWVEALLGGMLAAGAATRPAAGLTAVLMGFFAAALWRAARRGRTLAIRCAPGLSCRA